MSRDDKTYIAVRVTPRSGRDEVVGVHDITVENGGAVASCATCASSSTASFASCEIYVRVTSPPDGGKANKAVCKLIASSLGIPKTSVEVVSGATSRHKRLAVALSFDQVALWVASLKAC